MTRKKYYWLTVGAIFLLAISFVFTSSFRLAIARRRAIHQNTLELRQLDQQVEAARKNLSRLQTDPNTYEQLVRRELGYIKPGEKEVRFVAKKGS